MSKNNILQQIHKEKLELKQSYLQGEEKIADNFNYLQDNWGKLLMHSALNSAKGFIGLPTSTNRGKSEEYQSNKIQQFSSVGLTVIPMMWELVQPFLIKYGVNKIKSFFTKKKKKKKDVE